ncbi:MAG: hypothetical protein IT168_33215 [Bryobacterales bacterium]|nr:hypothetical protein [Bryobacterales bacterium]
MTLPTSLPVEFLDAQHPDYVLNAGSLDDIELLYRGGQNLKSHAERFLIKRPRELSEVYRARCERFTYQNILGTALGWYQSALFADDPDILIRHGEVEAGDVQREPYMRFFADCDRAGTTFVDLWRDAALSLMLYRSAFFLTDLPKIGDQPATLAEQKALGALDPYLVLYDPRQVINWECDAYGNLSWVVIATVSDQRSFGAATTIFDRWYYFDRTTCGVYEARREKNGEKAETAALIHSGPHALAEAGRVPVRWIQLPESLWLANRAHLQVIDHLNQDNSYSWALFMACHPVPVIKGDYKQPPQNTEVSYIHLAENGAFEWAEPSGASFEHSANRIAALREEIYRQLYLQAQGRSSTASASAQSGFSKEMDMAPSRDVLNGFGDVIRAGMKNVLLDVAAIRGDDLTFNVTGFDFDAEDPADIESDQATLDMSIPSSTLRKEIWKRAAMRKLKDARPEIRESVKAEIDASPNDPEADRLAARTNAIRAGLTSAIDSKIL